MSHRPTDGAARSVRSELNLYIRLLREARPYWPQLGAVFIISLLASPVALLVPLPLKIVVDHVAGSQPLPRILQAFVPETAQQSAAGVVLVAAALVLVITLLDQLQKLGSWVLTTYTGEKLALLFRARLFSHVQRMSLAYHDSRGTADSIYRIQHDAHSVQGIVIGGLIPLVSAGMTFVGMVIVTSRIDGVLALVALAVAPGIYLLTSASSRYLRSGWQKAKTLESAALSVVQEALTGLRVVKAFGQEEREQARFVTSASLGIHAKTKTLFLEGVLGLCVGLATAIGTACVLVMGMRHVQAGLLSLGDLVLIMGYLTQLYVPVQTISASMARWQSSLVSAERAFSLLDEAHDVPETPNPRSIARAAGAVAFRGVSFAYTGRDRALREVSFEVAAGTRVGVSGPTGAGKTTLMSLLMRLYDPTEGQVLVDGVDLRDYRITDLRNQFAVVLQEPVLFSASIGENIAYARPEASEREIVEAARAAEVHEFVMGLPEGYETTVGERGMSLSGGERQRISLARAYLRDAPILILDEPTSSVDVKTEAAIMGAMERLMRGRTTFFISHRPSTLSTCDLQFRIENGELRETALYGKLSPFAG
jgi:ATP-binding cassette subfamily B protein